MELQKQGYIQYLDAIHINHQQVHSEAMMNHCKNICRQLAINLVIKSIPSNTPENETSWRDARYQLIADNTSLMTQIVLGHHRNDNIETIMLNLFRGCGVIGLSGIKTHNTLCDRLFVRPFLNIDKKELSEYVMSSNLNYFEDPSNQLNNTDRNYLRNITIPSIQKKWPNAIVNIAKMAHNLKNIKAESNAGISTIHTWLNNHAIYLNKKQTNEMVYQFCFGKKDRRPCYEYQNKRIVTHHKKLFIINLDIQPQKDTYPISSDKSLQITKNIRCTLKYNSKIGIDPKFINDITIGFRKDGESIYLKELNKKQSLKKFFQRNNIPWWIRSSIPLIYYQDKIIGVVGFSINSKFLIANGIQIIQSPSYHSILDLLPQMSLGSLVDLSTMPV